MRCNDVTGMYNDLCIIYSSDIALMKTANEEKFIFCYELGDEVCLVF